MPGFPLRFFFITDHLNFKIDAKKEHVDLRNAVCGSNMLELEFKMSKQSIDRIEIVVLLLGGFSVSISLEDRTIECMPELTHCICQLDNGGAARRLFCKDGAAKY